MSEWAIETEGLSKRYRKLDAVHDLSLRVPKGSVYGFLGKNGAGKTTTIKMLLGLLRPSAGSARIMGRDAQREGVWIRQHIGYVSEDRPLYRWMTVGETLWFVKAGYPSWNNGLAAAYLKEFGLDEKQKIKHLSKGMIGKLWLIMALAHEPEVLVLDEPTSGLDASVRRDFLEGIVRLMSEQGKTVFFSSHNLADVERVADDIAIVDQGRLTCSVSLETLKKSTRRVVMHFSGAVPEIALGPDMRVSRRFDRGVALLVEPFRDSLLAEWRQTYQPVSIEVEDVNLEDYFVQVTGEAVGHATRAFGASEQGPIPDRSHGRGEGKS